MHEWLGFLLVVVGGCGQGVYYLPIKYVTPWKWENIWALYAFVALILIPVWLATSTVPDLREALSIAPNGAMLRVFLFGAGWGVGSVLSGLGVARMGMAMGVPILISTATALGTFIPLVVGGPEKVFQIQGLMVILSVVTLLAGVAVIAVAGKKRAASQTSATESRPVGIFRSGLTICIFSGIFSSMFNLAFAFSRPLSKAAMQTGASETSALNMVWMVALIGGFIPTALYTGYLLMRNRTWNNYRLPGTAPYWIYGILMALTWTGGVILYGRGASAMGPLGAAIGFPLSMVSLIVGSSVVGFITGEWKGSSSQAKVFMAGGLALLLVAAGFIGVANRL